MVCLLRQKGAGSIEINPVGGYMMLNYEYIEIDGVLYGYVSAMDYKGSEIATLVEVREDESSVGEIVL